MNVFDAVEQRRSVKSYDAAHTMPEEDFKKLIELTMLAPSSFNIQHTRFVRITDKAVRQNIRQVAWDQPQVTDASELLVICADVKAWEKDPAQYWRNAPPETTDLMVSMITSFYEEKEQLQRDEALRSFGLSAQTLMLTAKAMGYDTCPMMGFDQAQVAEIINLPNDHVIGMMMAIGKAEKAAFPRGVLNDYDTTVIGNKF